MFIAGVSTHKVGEVAQTLMGVAPSASAISRLNQDLEQQFKAWRERRLQEHWRILYLDGIHLSVRHGEQADSTVILTALGVDLAGNKEVLALRACAEEDKEGWLSVLHDLRARGATQLDLIVTDGHDGLLAAVVALFPATPRQRCLLHKQRNVLNAVPRRVRREVETELLGIWAQPDKPGALTQLAAITRQIWPTLPRGCAKSGRRGRQDVDLLRLSADHASLHPHHQCHREFVQQRAPTH
jgi:putative transposase